MMQSPYTPAPDRYDSGMTYRRCGRSGILLPALSLGFWHNFGAVDALANARALAHYAFDKGITHFDLANNYGPPYGSAEETLGALMDQSFRPYRDELFISTKAGYDMWPGPYGNWGSRKYLMASLDQSLRRMHLDYVDLFYIHRYDPLTPLTETLQALVDIVRQGKTLYVGISRWPEAAAREGYAYLRSHDVPCLLYQGRYNLLDRAVEKEGILQSAADEGVGFIGFSPLAEGVLTNRYLHGIPADSRVAHGGHLKKETLTAELLQRVHKLDELARLRGQELSQMALAWILRDPRVTSVIVGASSVHQLQTNLAALNHLHFDEAELQVIDALALGGSQH